MNHDGADEVFVCKFYDPYSIWIITKEDSQKRDKLNDKLNQKATKIIPSKNIKKGQVVAIKYGQKLKRAKVENIIKTGDNQVQKYICWLLDYAILVNTEEVFDCLEELGYIEAFAKRAILYGVIPVQQKFNLVQNIHEKVLSTEWSPAIDESVWAVVNQPNVQFFFKENFSINKMLVGELLSAKPLEKKQCFSKLLCDSGCASYNELKFIERLSKLRESSDENISLVTPCRNASVSEINELPRMTCIGRGCFRKDLKYNNPKTISKQNKLQFLLKEQTFGKNDTVQEQTKYEEIDASTSILPMSAKENMGNEEKYSQNQIKLGATVEDNMHAAESDSSRNIPADSNNSADNSAEESRIRARKCLNLKRAKNTSISSTSDQESIGNDKYLESPEKTEIKMKDDMNSSERGSNDWASTNSENSSDISIEEIRKKAKELLKLRRSNKVTVVPISTVEAKEPVKEINSETFPSQGRGRYRKTTADPLTDLRQVQEKLKSPPEKPTKLVNTEPKLDVLPYLPAGATITQAKSKSKRKCVVPVKKNEGSSDTDSQSIKLSTEDDSTHINTESEQCSNSQNNIINNESEHCQYKSTECLKNGKLLKYVSQGSCKCSTCTKWETTNDGIYEDYEKPVALKKDISKPALIFKNGEENTFDSDYKIRNEIDDTAISKHIKSILLVHGQSAPNPARSVVEIPFHVEIHEGLKRLKYESPYRIQVYGWPAIMRGHHTFLVNTSQTGKTMTYVPAIASFVILYAEGFPTSMGPISIVVCPEAAVAEDVYKRFLKLWPRGNRNITLLTRPWLRSVKNQEPDIIIGTLPVLIEAIHDELIGLKRLSHVVFEEASELYSKYSSDMTDFLKIIQSILVNRTYNTSIQLIVVSQTWCRPIEKLLQNLIQTPIVCIGSFLEASVYGRINMKLHFLQLADKVDNLIKITSKFYKNSKLIIVCNSVKEIEDYFEKIDVLGVYHRRIDSTCTTDAIMDIYEKWSSHTSENCFVLVCEEEFLNSHICITDATVMVQYSLPDSWSKFVHRFGVFLDSHSSPRVQDNKEKCTMHIYVDETNSEQFIKVISLLLRLRVPLSPDIMKMFKKGIEIIDKEKNNRKVPICKNKILFGVCHKPETCPARHNFYPETDIFSSIPQSGLVKLKLLRAYSPSKYCAYIIQHTDADGQVHSMKHNLDSVTNLMKDMDTEIKSMPLFDIDIGSWCIYEESPKVFWRCEIVKFVKISHDKKPTTVIVNFLDKAEKKEVNVTSLYILPNTLETIPPLCVRIILANIAPADCDLTYSTQVLDTLRKKLSAVEYDEESTYATARIRLTLRSIIWVTNFTIKEDIKGSAVLLKMSVAKSLLESCLAVANPDHLEKLYNSCREAKIPLYNYELPVIASDSKTPLQSKPAWAHLETSDEYHEVHFAAATNPDIFYVKLTKFYCRLDQLMKDINKAVKQEKYPKRMTVQEGCCYLAKDPANDEYARVLVTQLNGNNATCFFVDFGDFEVVNISKLKFLSNEFIQRLPFQVIECQLWGIKPEVKWTDAATNILYDYAFEPGTDIFRNLYVKVINKGESTLTSRKYSVILMDILNTDTIINNIFVENGFAQSVENINVEFDKVRSMYTIECNDESEDEYVQNEKSHIFDLDQEAEQWECHGNMLAYLPTHLVQSLLQKASENERPEQKVSPPKILPKSNYLTPFTIWKQNDKQIILRIQLADVKIYEVNVVRKKIFSFKSTVNNKFYELDLNLFRKVKSDFEHRSSGLQVEIKLKKEEEVEWERLTSGTTRNKHITYEICEVSDDESTAVLDIHPHTDDSSLESEMEYESD